MDKNEIYRDIAERTNGDIYIGVVGPVRTGKSTFIKRFMDVMVIPDMEDENEKARLTDELPQSAAGRTVMTTQPRFIPNDAAAISIADYAGNVRIRMVDCVGYMVEGAAGHTENNAPRMVRTPWFDHDIPFEDAAEIGTGKVISEHSTLGILVTTDGSITDIPREAYIAAEERVIGELEKSGKPFIVLLNSRTPFSPEVAALAASIAEKHGVIVRAADAMNMDRTQLAELLNSMLMAFPICSIHVNLPRWMDALSCEHWLMRRLIEPLGALDGVSIMQDHNAIMEALSGIEGYETPRLAGMELASGRIEIEARPINGMFYTVLSEECGYEIADDAHLVASIKEFVTAKREYDRVKCAIEAAAATGYGTVPPNIDDMQLDEPEIVQRGGRFGVRLRARATGLHVIRVDVESEVSPLVGTQQQSAEFASYLEEKFQSNPAQIWQTDIFGKSLYDMVREGMSAKVNRMPENVQQKLQDTVQRMVNDGCNGLICIML